MRKNYITFSEDCRVLKKDDRVILLNRDNGKKLKLSRECYDILKAASELKFTSQEVIKCIKNEGDKKYISELIQSLEDYKILKAAGKNERKKINKIVFELTKSCNLQCRHCSVNASINNNIIELSTGEIKHIIKKIGLYNCSTLIFTGGEPMTRRDFFEILDYTRGVFLGKIGLMTNGTLINEDNVQRLIHAVDFIDISVDGVDESSCSLIRGAGVFEKVINAVKLLKKNNFHKISLSMVKVEGNKHLIEDFYKLNKELCTQPVVRAFADVGRGLNNSLEFMPSQREAALIGKEDKALQKYTDNGRGFRSLRTCVCGAGSREIMLDPKGDIYPCVLLNKPIYKIGNVFEINFLSELEGIHSCSDNEAIKALRQNMPENHSKCKNCSVNLFCWGCIEELERISLDEKRFKDRCELNKSNLEKLVWSN